jgi:hypothetical protein
MVGCACVHAHTCVRASMCGTEKEGLEREREGEIQTQ